MVTKPKYNIQANSLLYLIITQQTAVVTDKTIQTQLPPQPHQKNWWGVTVYLFIDINTIYGAFMLAINAALAVGKTGRQ